MKLSVQLSFTRGELTIMELVLEVGLEPTKAEAGRFTVSCDCHYTIPALYGADYEI